MKGQPSGAGARARSYYVLPLEAGGLLRVYPPRPWVKRAPVLAFVHGWAGDETVMQPFGQGFAGTWQVYFRAPFAVSVSGRTGYQWLPEGASIDDPDVYGSAVRALEEGLARFAARFPRAEARGVHWVGFSQGAAVATLFGLHHPARVASLTGFVGYLPQGLEERSPTDSWPRPVFLAFGRKDPIVAQARAQAMVRFLRRLGASVEVCWGDVGHKVATTCHRHWNQWLHALLD